MTPDLEPYRRAERLEWHPWTVFNGDETGGDGNMDGDLRAINQGEIVANVPLDIFTPESADANATGSAPWKATEKGFLGILIANPRTRDEVREEIRGWCRREVGRDDVAVNL